MSKGKLFVISGASGVGKSSVLKELLAQREDLLFSVSATTRNPRANETDGVNYRFVTRAEFQRMIDADEFLEYDNHMENFYGTPSAQLEEKLTRGNVILDIEPNGAFAVRNKRPDAVLIFIAPPSMQELTRRLQERKDTTPKQVAIRLERAKWEKEQAKRYDYVVKNKDLAECTAEILKIIAEKAD